MRPKSDVHENTRLFPRRGDGRNDGDDHEDGRGGASDKATFEEAVERFDDVGMVSDST